MAVCVGQERIIDWGLTRPVPCLGLRVLLVGAHAQERDPSARVSGIAWPFLRTLKFCIWSSLRRFDRVAFLWLKMRSAVLHLLPGSQSPFIKDCVDLGCTSRFEEDSGVLRDRRGDLFPS